MLLNIYAGCDYILCMKLPHNICKTFEGKQLDCLSLTNNCIKTVVLTALVWMWISRKYFDLSEKPPMNLKHIFTQIFSVCSLTDFSSTFDAWTFSMRILQWLFEAASLKFHFSGKPEKNAVLCTVSLNARWKYICLVYKKCFTEFRPAKFMKELRDL